MIFQHLQNSDKLTPTVAPYLGLAVDQAAMNSVTRGLVGDTSFAVLPEISARMTFIMTLFFQIVSLNVTTSFLAVS